MEALTARDEQHNRWRARALFFGAAALVLFGVAEVLLQGLSWPPLVVRGGWAVAAGLAALGVRGPRRDAGWQGLTVLGGVSPFFYAGLLQHQGGVGSVAFASFMATPILAALLLPGVVSVAVATAVANVAAGLALLAYSGVQGALLGEWALALSTAGVFAIWAATQQRRMQQTERRALEATVEAQARAAASELARVDAERRAMLGQLAGGLAHEVNNPLGILMAGLDEFGEWRWHLPTAQQQEAAKTLENTATAVRRVAGVVRELGFVVPDQAPASAVDVLAVMRPLVASLAAGGLHIEDRLPATLPPVRASAGQLERVVRHLVQSACPPGDEAPTFLVSASAHESWVLLVLEDDGPPLWTQVRPPGSSQPPSEGQRGANSGLGLALGRESLRQWGGGLEVGPRDGGGVRTVLRLAAMEPRDTRGTD